MAVTIAASEKKSPTRQPEAWQHMTSPDKAFSNGDPEYTQAPPALSGRIRLRFHIRRLLRLPKRGDRLRAFLNRPRRVMRGFLPGTVAIRERRSARK